MDVPARVVVSTHTINRIRQRFAPLQRFAREQITKQVERCLPAAVSVCNSQDARKIVAAPICEMDTIYLVTKMDGDTLFVITCLTEKMVQETIRITKKHRHQAMTRCPFQIHGKQPERRRRVRRNRFHNIEEADE